MDLPLLDISAFKDGWSPAPDKAKSALSAALMDACTQTGFFYLSGHGVLPQTIEATRRAVVDFFALPEEQKTALTILPDNYRGYVPLGFFTPNDGEGGPENYEAFKLHYQVEENDPVRAQSDLYGPNRWPHQPGNFRDTLLTYWQDLERCNDILVQASTRALGLPDDCLMPMFDKPLTSMTLLHYPPMGKDQDGFGIHPHKDTNIFTLLYPDPVGGLEVRHRDGAWIEARAPQGAFVVNIGDMMEVFSGGRFISTPHRVINRTGQERYSFPWFSAPRYDTVIEPLVSPLPGFVRPVTTSGEWSAAIWYSNYPDKQANNRGLHLGSLRE